MPISHSAGNRSPIWEYVERPNPNRNEVALSEFLPTRISNLRRPIESLIIFTILLIKGVDQLGANMKTKPYILFTAFLCVLPFAIGCAVADSPEGGSIFDTESEEADTDSIPRP